MRAAIPTSSPSRNAIEPPARRTRTRGRCIMTSIFFFGDHGPPRAQAFSSRGPDQRDASDETAISHSSIRTAGEGPVSTGRDRGRARATSPTGRSERVPHAWLRGKRRRRGTAPSRPIAKKMCCRLPFDIDDRNRKHGLLIGRATRRFVHRGLPPSARRRTFAAACRSAGAREKTGIYPVTRRAQGAGETRGGDERFLR